MSLEGKVVVVTGGSRGQGRAEIELAAAEGAHCFIADILEEEGRELESDLRAAGHDAVFVRLDVSDPDGWTELRRVVTQLHGRLDALVNNAGVAFRHGIMDTEPDDWHRILSVNLDGPYLGMRSLAPMMRDSGGGAIVNIGSTAGISGHFTAAYAASKWGLRGLTKHAAMEFAGWRIRVNTVLPGLVDTDILPGDREFPDAMTRRIPLKRAAQPAEIARIVLFLIGDDSRYMTAADIAVDGGFVDLGAFGGLMQDLGRASY